MPNLHRKNKTGRFYVLANVQGRVVTYQTKWKLHERFCREGRKENEHIDQREVFQLVQGGELYTTGAFPVVPITHPELLFESDILPAETRDSQTPESSGNSDPGQEMLCLHPDQAPKQTWIMVVSIVLVLLAIMLLWMLSGASTTSFDHTH